MTTTYGAWKITEREYQVAQKIALEGGDGAADAYQLVRYCRGQIFCRDDAERGCKLARAMLAQNAAGE